MKKHEIIFSLVKIPIDFLLVIASFYIAREIRIVTDLIPGVSLPIKTIDDSSLLGFALAGAVTFVFVMAIHGKYSMKMTSSKIKEALDIVRYSVYFFILYSAIVYFANDFVYQLDIPRLILLFTLVLSIFFVLFSRVILYFIQSLLLLKGRLSKRKIVLICSKNNENLSDIIEDINLAKIYDLVGYIGKVDAGIDLEYLGGIDDVKAIIKQRGVDECIYVESDYSQDELFEIWEMCRIYGVRYRYFANNFDITKANTEVSLLNNISLIEIKNSSLDAWGRVYKRFFDILAGIFGVIIFLPIGIIVGILIKLEDPAGPIFYKNRRVGYSGKEFFLYKFRYMKWEYCVKDSYGVGENEDKALDYEKALIEKSSSRKGPLYKIENDPRKTKIGAFIEKYSIDELPQFFNIILGDMSLVGPRPHQPREVKDYKEYQVRVLNIKPGLTGMAQVNGREQNSFDDEVKFDIFYIENWSLLLDLKIIFKTIKVILTRK